jgi:hypothetical protein
MRVHFQGQGKAMKNLFYVLVGVLLTACAGLQKPPYVAASPQVNPASYITKNFSVSPYYNEVIFSGPLTVTVNNQQISNQLSVSGTQEAFKQFSANINNGILTIQTADPVNVKINLPSTIQKISSRNNANINLTGTFVLSHIEASGHSILRLYWIDSSNLHVVAENNSQLFLAGVVTNLDLLASGDADVDAKYLRVENAYVKTQNDADVNLNVKNSLGSLSSDKSTIYYYQDSHLNSHYLNNSGSALRMVGIPSNH